MFLKKKQEDQKVRMRRFREGHEEDSRRFMRAADHHIYEKSLHNLTDSHTKLCLFHIYALVLLLYFIVLVDFSSFTASV